MRGQGRAVIKGDLERPRFAALTDARDQPPAMLERDQRGRGQLRRSERIPKIGGVPVPRQELRARHGQALPLGPLQEVRGLLGDRAHADRPHVEQV